MWEGAFFVTLGFIPSILKKKRETTILAKDCIVYSQDLAEIESRLAEWAEEILRLELPISELTVVE